MRILTDEEVVKGFGDPRPFILQDGSASPLWEKQILTKVVLPAPLPLSFGGVARIVRCHTKIASALNAALSELKGNAALWASLGDFGGCYCFRPNRNNRRKLSRHCWGIAVDIDVKDNPMHSRGHMLPGVINVFARHGFTWGGYFSDPDPMHFEASDQLLP